ncbi:Alpha-ribazole-5\'-phosphate phosphatase [Oleispira antarctica RB-8]|uniref:Alpha-ribazole-5\'-phosphate phosphatase n=1 Tax=Oleispira antarctica RB-8 TaxID=698738 RepID=R4YTN2_OLEAN|nr:Alpha-ribazole-5\'-phosphate phosphatase [Oleispira antarctica RB-8]|tara:strand:+ start:185 stop:871 length:687 start_codon:yes stop_codon:yes gene_type:complete
MQPTFIDVMRHGEPEGTCSDGGTILRGSTDDELTPKGWAQARKRTDMLLESGEQWDVIISSPLLRCANFAQSLVLKKSKDKSERLFISAAWREIYYGDWDGLSTAKIWQDAPELMEKMWQDPLEFCAPNGEAVKDFSVRIEQAWSDLLRDFQGKRVLLVCHGGVMRLLLKQLLLLAPEAMNRFAIPYAAVSRFRVDHSVSDEGVALTWPSLMTHLGDEIQGDEASSYE